MVVLARACVRACFAGVVMVILSWRMLVIPNRGHMEVDDHALRYRVSQLLVAVVQDVFQVFASASAS